MHWTHPPMDWYALNTNGATKGSPGPAGGGVLIHDHLGGTVSAMAINISHITAFKAEVVALTKGLELARELQISKLIVQMDNLVCVTMINKRDWGRNDCSHMLKRCIDLSQHEEWEVRVVHIYREGNRAADWLANPGVSKLLPSIIFSSAPNGLGSILDEDLRGVVVPRLIPP